MTLRSKTTILLIITLAVFILVVLAIGRLMVYPSFESLERAEAGKNMQRWLGTLNRELDHLKSFCFDWSAWDDSYRFIKDQNPGYIKSNLVLSTFTSNRLNLIFIYDLAGKVVWGKVYDLKSKKPISLKQFPTTGLPLSHPLLKRSAPAKAAGGIILTQKGPMLVAAAPILQSNDQGPSRGNMVMGRLLTKEVLKALAEQTQVKVRVWPLASGSLPAGGKAVLRRLQKGPAIHIREVGPELLQVFASFPHVSGAPALLMGLEVPREITAKGMDALAFAAYSLVAAGLLALLLSHFVLQLTVVSPLARLTRHVLEIGRQRNFSLRLGITKKDEIGVLSREFDHMVEQVAQYLEQQQRVEQERAQRQNLQAAVETAGAVCHELNQPLQVLLSTAEIMRLDVEPNHPLQEKLQAIMREVEKLGVIIGRLKNITKYETKTYVDNVKILDLAKSNTVNWA